jgi:hypothetical protein
VYRDGDVVGQRAVADRQVDAVMVLIDRPSGLLRRPLDLFASIARFGGSQEAAQPAVAQLTDTPETRRGGAAEPDVQRLERAWCDTDRARGEVVAGERDIVVFQSGSQQP